MKRINLYQAEFRPPRIALPARSIGIAGIAFLAGLIALYVWGNWQLAQLKGQVSQIVQRADAVTRQLAASAPENSANLDQTSSEAASLETRARLLQQAEEAISSGALGSETGYTAQFRALSRALGNTASGGAWLTRVTFHTGGHGMDLQGRALTGDAAAHLIGNLRREPLFVGLSFAGLKIGPPATEPGQGEPHPASNVVAAPRFLEFSLHARAQMLDTNTRAPGGAP